MAKTMFVRNDYMGFTIREWYAFSWWQRIWIAFRMKRWRRYWGRKYATCNFLVDYYRRKWLDIYGYGNEYKCQCSFSDEPWLCYCEHRKNGWLTHGKERRKAKGVLRTVKREEVYDAPCCGLSFG